MDSTDKSRQPGTEPREAEGDAAVQPVRRKRRWLRALLIVLIVGAVGMAALIAAAPTLLSTAPAQGFAVRMANERMQGSISLERLSLSWFDRCTVSNLKAADPQGREVLSASEVRFDGGVWDALGALRKLEQLTIENPEAVLYFEEDGTLSIAHAFAPIKPSPKEPADDEPTSVPEGGLSIRNGAVRLVQTDGRTLDFTEIDADVEIAQNRDIDGTVRLAMVGGGKLSADVTVSNLLDGGRIDLQRASAEVSVRTDEGFNAEPISAFALPESATRGQVSVEGTATANGDRIEATLRVAAEELLARSPAGSGAAPISLVLDSSVKAGADRIEGGLHLTGGAGEVTTDFEVNREKGVEVPSGEQIMAAILDGKNVGLPELSLETTGKVDLPALARAVPGILSLKPGTEVTEGRIELSKLSVKGGSKPSVVAAVEVRNLTAMANGQTVACEPIDLSLDAAVEQGRGLAVREATLKSGFGRVTASGSMEKLQATVEGDLDALNRQFGQVFDLGGSPAGRLLANLSLARSGEGNLDYAVQIDGERLTYRTADGTLSVQRAQVRGMGAVVTDSDHLPRVSLGESKIDLDGMFQAEGTGSYDAQAGAFQGKASITHADLAYLDRHASGLGVAALNGLTGEIRLAADLEQAAADAPLATRGEVEARGLRMDGEELASTLEARWSGVQYSGASGDLRVDEVNVEGGLAQLSARQIQATFGDKPALDGRVRVSADLAKCLPLVARLTESEQPRVSGRLTLNADCKSTGSGFNAAGDARIVDLAYATDNATIRDQLQLGYDFALSQQDEHIDVRKLDISSQALTASLSGGMDKYASLIDLAIDGQYEIVWGKLNDVLHQVAPSTRDLITVSGTHKGELSAKGPLAVPGAQPGYRDLKASADLGWKSATVYGIPLGGTALKPSLENGKLKLPPATFDAAGGKVRLAGVLDLSDKTPALRIPKELTVLEKIKITPQLARELLSRFNPVFGQSTRVDGLVNLRVKNIELPLGDAKGGGRGIGQLQFKNTKMQPAGLLAELVRLGGLGDQEMYTVKFSGLKFKLSDGRIHYKGFRMVFANNAFDLLYRGSVGFDGTLDLVVSVPVRPALLKRLGVTGPVAQYAKKLAKSRVELPIAGTRENPRLDLSKVDVQKLLKDAVSEGLLESGKDVGVDDLTDPSKLLEGAGSLLGGDRDDRKDDRKKSGQNKNRGSRNKGKKGSGKSASDKKESNKQEEGSALGDLLEDLSKKKDKKKGD